MTTSINRSTDLWLIRSQSGVVHIDGSRALLATYCNPATVVWGSLYVGILQEVTCLNCISKMTGLWKDDDLKPTWDRMIRS